MYQINSDYGPRPNARESWPDDITVNDDEIYRDLDRDGEVCGTRSKTIYLLIIHNLNRSYEIRISAVLGLLSIH